MFDLPFTELQAVAIRSGSQNKQWLPENGRAGCPILPNEKRQPKRVEKPVQNLDPRGAGECSLAVVPFWPHKSRQRRKQMEIVFVLRWRAIQFQ